MLRKLPIGRLPVLVFILGSLISQVCAQGSPVLYASSKTRITGGQGAQTYALLDLLKDLEKKFNVVFDYDKRSLKGKTITILRDQLKSSDISETLNAVLPPLGLQYKKYSDRSYIIYQPKEERKTEEKDDTDGTSWEEGAQASTTEPVLSAQAVSIEAFAAVTISGTVIDDTGSPMPGVNVIVKGTTVGTSTDADGKYKLDVADENAVLVFSFIGYETIEIAATNRTVIDVTMVSDINTLSEVVVVGYGTIRKRDLTGSVYSVKSDVIVQTPTHNALEAIQGKVPGVDITRKSGAAGSGTNILVRGTRSINGANSPLYVIDGVQMPQHYDPKNPDGQSPGLSDLNPSDIESIEVLKDASATAIYGAMGANGVIIVTTKKGGDGKTKVSYNGYYGVNYYTYPEARTGDDYLQLRREAYRTVGEWNGPGDDLNLFPETLEREAYQAGQWVNWVDLVKQNGSQQSHSIDVAGGTEKTRIFASLGYFKEEGMLRDNDFTRYSARFNLDQTISKWIKAGLASQVSYSIQNDRNDPLSDALAASPFGVPYDANGIVNTFPIAGNPSITSPLADEKNSNIAHDNTIRTNIIANGFLEMAPVKGLTFRTNFGANLEFSRRGIYEDKESLRRASKIKTSYASSESTFGRYFNWDNVLTYTRSFADHTVTLTGITSYVQRDKDITTAKGTNLFDASQLFYGLDGAVISGYGAPYVGSRNMAYAGRVNYNYKGKYLFTASGRYDGASRLAPGNKWVFFPSVAVGWNISDEPFLANVEPVSLLKVRASYGESGNYSIAEYATQSGLTALRTMSFGEVAAPMYQFKSSIGNPDLGWETSATTNIGLDAGFLKDRLLASVDVYKTSTSDILMERQLPQSSGVEKVFQNVAETENKGIEISVTSKNFDSDRFRWNTTLTFSSNKEEITALIDKRDIINGEENSLLIGRPIKSFYTFDKQGIWQNDEADQASQYRAINGTGNTFQPGDIKVADLNKDFIINADSDRMYIGSTVPKWVAGLQNTFQYKGFDLNIFILFRYGQTIDAEFLGRYNPSGEGNGPSTLDYWTPENPTNDYPRPRKGVNLNSYTGYIGYQALTYVDGSFFKVRNVTLGYTLPSAIVNRALLTKVRFYVTSTNPFIKAKSHLLKDYDPERGGAESSPLSRQVVFGVNVDF